ncbi:MAG: serine hydrolase domain-containing protein [Verrucomicrobiota bacterium]
MKSIPFLLFFPVFVTSAFGAEDLVQKAADYHENQQAENEGVVFGRIEGSKTSFGSAGLLGENRAAVNEHSLFEIGSITKTFTGVLLADQILLGKVSLEDPITKFLPDDIADESPPLATVTFLELATHTSGLPRIPTNLDEGADPTDPYAHYSVEKLYEYLKDFEADDFEEKGRASYSNLGLGLLGHLLELMSGKSYEELLIEVILDPLQMQETYFQRTVGSIPDSVKDRFATGHRKGKEVPHWRIDSLGPAGAIVSSASDMLLFAAAHWSPDTPEQLKGALELSTKTHSGSFGLGWFVDGEKVSHDGGTGGFRSSLSIDTKAQTATIKLENGISPTLSEEITGDFSPLEGYWSGTLTTRTGELRQVMRITGKGAVHLHSIDQGGTGIRAAVARFEEQKLECKFPSIGGSYGAELGDGILKGSWTQGSDLPLDLTHSPEVPPELEKALQKIAKGDFKELEGYWSGFLGGKQGLFVILRIDPIGNSADIGLYSPDQSDAALPVTKVDFADGKLDFASAPLNATYEAELDGETLEGTWSQGVPLPLTLRWSEEKPERE